MILKCNHCDGDFFRNTSQHKSAIKRGRKNFFCSQNCANAYKEKPLKELICKNCSNIFYRKKCGKDRGLFCSMSCASRFNNPKKFKEPKFIEVKIPTTTLQDLKNNYNRSQYHAKIRGLSRLTYFRNNKVYECEYCGYDKHIDVCHIIDVKDFPLETLVVVVNDINNLIGLCKNHHWEFDHGYLSLNEIR